MLIPKKNRHAIYSYLFNEGVLCAKKDFNAPKHHTIEVPNLYVIKAMQSLKSRGFVTEKFCWQWYFWYLTNPGINHLRDYLHLSDDVVPATVKATTSKKTSEPRGFGEGRYDREGYRGGGRGRFGDREGYRGGDRPGFDEKKTGPPGEGFQPSFREGGGRGRGFGRGYDREGGGYRGGDREGGYRGGDREGGGYRGGDREGGGYRGGDREGGGYRGGDREGGGYRGGGDREGGGYRGGGDREGGGYRGGDREGGYRGDREGGYSGRGGYRGGGGEGGERGSYPRSDSGGYGDRGFAGRGRGRAEGGEYRRTEGGAGFPSGGRGAPPPRT